MPHVAGTVIGANRIGAYAVIYHQVTLGAKAIDPAHGERPEIGDRVFIASGAKVIGAITLGDDCVIGANAVVTKSWPAGMTLTGIPASRRAAKSLDPTQREVLDRTESGRRSLWTGTRRQIDAN